MESQSLGRSITTKLITVVILAAIAAFFMALGSVTPKPFASVELKFSDSSAHGLAIVPASCPSNPFDASSPFGCSGGTPVCPDGVSAAPNGDPSQCSCSQGNRVACGVIGTPPNAPQTSGTPLICGVGYSQQGNQCVFTGCPSGYTQQGSQCVLSSCGAGYICLNGNQYYEDATCHISSAPTQQCGFGCNGGACIPPPAPQVATWQVKPTLVQSGETATIAWNAQNVASCAVTGSNGDGTAQSTDQSNPGVWNTLNGSKVSSPIKGQTIYTITCQGFPGASPASASASATINIAPNFNEQ